MAKKIEIKKGISLLVLIINIVVIIILMSIIVPFGMDKINTASIATFNNNILSIGSEVQAYMIMNQSQYPTKKDGSGNDIIYSISSSSTLLQQATQKNDQNDIFYVLDIDKIKLDNKDLGAGKTKDDYFIIASTSKNIYYVKGIEVDGKIYHTKFSDTDKMVYIKPTVAPTITPVATLTPVPNGAWDGTVNSPKLGVGMTAIRWDGSAWVKADRSNINNNWYDYRNTGGTANKWANAQLSDGSMLVWIPRYTYQIASGEHSSTAGTINIRFSNGTTDDTSGGYRIHPAFYWGGWNIPASATMTKQAGGNEVTGIWVGKFECSATNGLQDISGDKITIKPNLSSWRTLKVGDMFDKCYQMQSLYTSVYGIDANRLIVDAHMLKNSEWAAVAYLSKYARGANEVQLNDNSSFIGGKGDYMLYTDLSTTGTEYGIYDMRGSAWEYVASYMSNNDSNLTTNGSSIVNASSKYKDVFPVAGTDAKTNNYNLTDKAYGYAFWETSTAGSGSTGWFLDFSLFMELSSPFTERGGNYLSNNDGGMFYFGGNRGDASVSGSWRVGIVVP